MKKLLIFSCFLINNAIYSMYPTRRDYTSRLRTLDDARVLAFRVNIARKLGELDPIIRAYFKYVADGQFSSDQYYLSMREHGCYIAPVIIDFLREIELERSMARLGLCTFARVTKTATLAPYTAKRPAPIDTSEPVTPRPVVVPPFVAPVKQPNASNSPVITIDAHQRTLAKRAQRKRAKERQKQVQELAPVVVRNLPISQAYENPDLVVDSVVKKSNWWFCCRRKK